MVLSFAITFWVRHEVAPDRGSQPAPYPSPLESGASPGPESSVSAADRAAWAGLTREAESPDREGNPADSPSPSGRTPRENVASGPNRTAADASGEEGAAFPFEPIRAEPNSSRLNGGTALSSWAIQVASPALAEALGRETGAIAVQPHPVLDTVYLLQIPGSAGQDRARELASVLARDERVAWFDQQYARPVSIRLGRFVPPFKDPGMVVQWHLDDRETGFDAAVFDAWERGYSGEGVVVGVIDSGIEIDHPDLAPNYRPTLSRDVLDSDNDPSPTDLSLGGGSAHGTSVSGLVAAAADGSGMVGVAHGVGLAAIRLLAENADSSADFNDSTALGWQRQSIDIYNNSWGPVSDAPAFLGIGGLTESVLLQGVEDGRGGLGNIYVNAAGNQAPHNVALDAFASSPYTIAVGAVSDDGSLAPFSQRGPSILVSAPSSGGERGIATADLTGPDGLAGDSSTTSFGGTSAAAPIVAGVVALMLEANPELSWRDVMEILARTAMPFGDSFDPFTENAGGFKFHEGYGFGRVNAAGAVRLAETWSSLPPLEIRVFRSTTATAIPASPQTQEYTIDFTSPDIRVEQVRVGIELNQAGSWPFGFDIVSPAGTEVELHPSNQVVDTLGRTAWRYTVVHLRGEEATGTWRLRLHNPTGISGFNLESWSVTVLGSRFDPLLENQPPLASSDTVGLDRLPGSIPVLANDTDPEGEALEIISVSATGGLRAALSGVDRLILADDPAFSSSKGFHYLVRDPANQTAWGEGVLPGTLRALPEVSLFLEPGSSRTLSLDSLTGVSLVGFNLAEDPLPTGITIADQGNGELRVTAAPDAAGSYSIPYRFVNGSFRRSGVLSLRIASPLQTALDFGEDKTGRVSASSAPAMTTPYTLEAWIYPTGYGSSGSEGFGRIIERGPLLLFLNGYGHPLYNDSSLLFGVDTLDSLEPFRVANTPSESIRLNQWQHIAVTYDGTGDPLLYIDGIAQPLTFPFGSLAGETAQNASGSLSFGNRPGGDRQFQGRIDDFKHWNRILPSQEIAASPFPPEPDSRTGLLASWSFNEGSGSVTMGSGIGSITNAPFWSAGRPPSATSDSLSFASWLARESVSPEDAGALANPDGDGLSQIFEYVTDSNPQMADPADPLPFFYINRREGATLLGLLRNPRADEARIELEQSDDLEQWQRMVEGLDYRLFSQRPDTEGRIREEFFILDPAPQRNTFRLRVEPSGEPGGIAVR